VTAMSKTQVEAVGGGGIAGLASAWYLRDRDVPVMRQGFASAGRLDEGGAQPPGSPTTG